MKRLQFTKPHNVAAISAVVAAHTNPPPPAPVNFGTDALANRQGIMTAVQNIRAYQALGAVAVTQVQRKAYEDLIGDFVVALARRLV
jgi:outer membrane biogenesis lipoprotein LolB